MGLIKLSLKSLKTDFSRSLFYFMAFVLTTIFIFSFFNLTFNPLSGIELGAGDKTFVTPIAVLVILVAMLCVFLANDFYVSSKSKDISITLMSGASVYQTGMYLFIQSFVIMLFAIPLGFFLGYLCIPIVNSLFASMFIYQGDIFYLSSKTLVATTVILLFEVGWCTLLNMGYCYRSTITNLMSSTVKIEWYGRKKKEVRDIFYIALYIIPFILFIINDDVMGFALIALIGCVGVYGMMKKVIPDYLTKQQNSSSLENPKQLLVYGFLKHNLQKVFMLSLMIMISSILLMAMIIYNIKTPIVSMIALLSYGSVMILMSLTILFKIGMELQNRKKNVQNIFYLGFVIEDIKKVMNREMLYFYGVLASIPLAYQLCIMLKLLWLQTISMNLAIMIVALQIIPLLISGIICTILYHKLLPKW